MSLRARRKSYLRHCFLASLTPSPSPVTSSLGNHCSSLSFPLEQTHSDRFGSAKRYERLMKFHGIHQSQSGSTSVSAVREASIASPRRKSPAPAGPSSKKRKLVNYAETTSNINTDDDEGLDNVKAESSASVKAEAVKAEPVKGEDTGEETIPDSTSYTGLTASTSNSAFGFDGIHDSAMFDDFLRFGGSAPANNESQIALSGDQFDGATASTSMTPATGSGDGHGMHESIVIVD